MSRECQRELCRHGIVMARHVGPGSASLRLLPINRCCRRGLALSALTRDVRVTRLSGNQGRWFQRLSVRYNSSPSFRGAADAARCAGRQAPVHHFSLQFEGSAKRIGSGALGALGWRRATDARRNRNWRKLGR